MKTSHFHKYYLPYLAELVEYVDGLGVPVLLHCCGHFKAYLPDLAQTKISAIHPMQRTANMDLRWVKRTTAPVLASSATSTRRARCRSGRRRT